MKSGFTEKIDNLNRELLQRYEFDSKLFSELIEIQRDGGLLYGDRPTCPFLRPHFLPRSKYNQIVRAAEIIVSAEEKLTYAALEDDALLEHLDLTAIEKRLVKIDPKYRAISTSSRFDTFISENGFRFLEYNAETPAGVGDQPQLEKVLESIPLIREFLEGNRHWRPDPSGAMLKSLLNSYREFGGKKENPNIAIVDWKGVSTESEFFVLQDYFESQGYSTRVLDPDEIEYNRKILTAGGFEIDIVYKRILIQELLDKYGEDHPLVDAYKDGNLCICNSFRVKIPQKKMSFAILTDEKYATLFNQQELDAFAKHIPWTRKLEDEKTTYKTGEIELLDYLRTHRESFLLKPNDDYGGKGITLGWESKTSEWESAIEAALLDSFIVQERAEILKEEFPVFDGKVSFEKLLVDFDPFLFENKVEGGLVRLSSDSLVNVTQGGGQTALVILEDY